MLEFQFSGKARLSGKKQQDIPSSKSGTALCKNKRDSKWPREIFMVQYFGFWRKDTEKRWKNGWEFDFVLRFHVSLGIRIYCSCLIVYYNSQYLFLPPEWILTSNKYAIFQLLRSLKKKTVLSTYEFDCKLILPPNSLDTMMDITNKITQVDKLLQLWCNSQALIISEGIGLFLG